MGRVAGYAPQAREAEQRRQHAQKRVLGRQAAPPRRAPRALHDPVLVKEGRLARQEGVHEVHGGEDGDGERREAVVGAVQPGEAATVREQRLAALEVARHGGRLVARVDDAIQHAVEDVGDEEDLGRGDAFDGELLAEHLKRGEACTALGLQDRLRGDVRVEGVVGVGDGDDGVLQGGIAADLGQVDVQVVDAEVEARDDSVREVAQEGAVGHGRWDGARDPQHLFGRLGGFGCGRGCGGCERLAAPRQLATRRHAVNPLQRREGVVAWLLVGDAARAAGPLQVTQDPAFLAAPA